MLPSTTGLRPAPTAPVRNPAPGGASTAAYSPANDRDSCGRLWAASARSRMAAPIRLRSAGSVISSASASARASTFPGSTTRPSTPSRTRSGMAPTVVATTGTPAAIASMIAIGWPSRNEGSTKTSASRSRSRTWAPCSGPTRLSARPAAANSATISAYSGSGVGPWPPTTTSRQSVRPRSRSSRAARASCRVPLRRQTTPTNSTVGGTRSGRVGANADTSIALSTVRTGVRPAKERMVSVPASDTVQTSEARRSVRSASRSSRE